MKSLKTIISQLKVTDEDKYLSREFQQYGIYLAQKLQDEPHKALYIKMAKEISREILSTALSFVLDSNARSKARLFMWKVKKLKVDTKAKKPL
jgi:hypothetical protein